MNLVKCIFDEYGKDNKRNAVIYFIYMYATKYSTTDENIQYVKKNVSSI